MVNENSAQNPDRSPSRSRTAGESFVGRGQELSQLSAALNDVLAGRGSLILLGGEPGIGKTRTAQEFGVYSRESGAEVLWGHCYEGQGAPLYWPWVQIIRSYILRTTHDQLRAEMGAGAADIAEIVSEVHEALPHLEPQLSLEPEQARFRLFDSITRFLKKASESRPLVLTLDNLHAADRSSLLLLEFLAQALSDSRLLVLGTYRDVELSRRHPLSNTLAELTRVPECQRILLRGLSVDDVQRLVLITAGIEPSKGFVKELHAHTEGNPLFLTEVLRLLIQRGELTLERMEISEPQHFSIPEGVRAVIGKRLDMLSEDCGQILGLASVIGREFDMMQLALLNPDAPESQTVDLLGEASAARIIEEVPGVIGRYRFTHALIQGTLTAEMSPMRRAQLNARFAEALEESYGDRADPVQLAYYYEQAAPVRGPEKLIRYSVAAGEQALRSYAYEEALEHFERGLAIKEGLPMDAETAGILVGIERALAPVVPIHKAQQVWDAASQAIDYFLSVGDIDKAVAVAIHPIPVLGGISGAADLFGRLLELVPNDSLEAGHLHSRRAISFMTEYADFENGHLELDKAISIARRGKEKVLEARSLANAVGIFVHAESYEETVDAGLKVIEVLQRVGDLQAEERVRAWTGWALLVLGRPSEAQIQLNTGFRAAERLHDRRFQSMNLLHNATTASLLGKWDEAHELVERGLEKNPHGGELISLKMWLSFQSNDMEAVSWSVDELLNMSGNHHYEAIYLPRIAYDTGTASYLDIAEKALDALRASPIQRDYCLVRRNAGIIAVLKEDIEECKKQYEGMLPNKGTVLPYGQFSTDRLLSLLARKMGNLEDSQKHFEDALTFCRKAGYRPELAWTCHDYANMLLERNGEDDLQKAVCLLDEALVISTDLGMRPLVERLEALKEQTISRPSQAPQYPDGLTQREVEVLRLVASGKTDRQIAEELVISVNTVGNHVTSILNKTGSANRTEAAAYAARQRLV